MAPTIDELRALDWKSLVGESKTRACDDLHKTLSRWIQGGTLAGTAKATWLTVEPVLALYIQLDVEAERPFHPVNLLDALEPDLLRGLVAVVEDVDSQDFRARVLDLSWLARASDHSRVGDAVQAYATSAMEQFDPHHWMHAYSRLKRCIEMGASVGQKHKAFLDAVASVEAAIEQVGVADPLWLVHNLMSLLLRYRVGDAAKYAALAHSIASIARQSYEANGVANGQQCQRERSYLDLEILWRRKLRDDDSVRRLHLEVADAFVRQADGVIAARWPRAKSVAIHFLGGAIERLRQVGGESARVDALRLRQQGLQRDAVAEMRAVEVSVDVTDAVKAAKAHVAGKPELPALMALAFCHQPPAMADLEEEVRLRAQESPFKSLVPQSFLGPRGTVLAEHAGVLNQTDDTGFQLEVMRIAHARQSSLATILLHPAAEQVRIEHGLAASWFVALAHASSFVPAGREVSYGRGLAAGLAGDYDLAAALLCPQFEHAVRELFFAHGIVTSTLPSSGVQNEFNLNQLLEHARAAEIFGNELNFDLRVLLTEKAGANLRNNLAHGLLDDHAKIGAKIYFWWMCLRLALVPVFAAQRGQPAPTNDDDGNEQHGAPTSSIAPGQ